MSNSAITKIQAIAIIVIVLAAASVTAYWYVTSQPAPPPEEITLEFRGWDYMPQVVEETLAEFEQDYPHIKVNYLTYPFEQYSTVIATQLLAGGADLDVIYVLGGDAPIWTESWLEPLDNYPGAEDYKNILLPAALQAGTHGGNWYGFTQDIMFRLFGYNTRMFSEAGITEPFSTWDELLEQAQQLKDAGVEDPDGNVIEYPLRFVWNPSDGGGLDIDMYSSVSSLTGGTGALFTVEDGQLVPHFEEDDPVYKQIEWMKEAWDMGLVNPASWETMGPDAQMAYVGGLYAIHHGETWHFTAINDPSVSKVVGEIELMTMPNTGYGGSFSDLYAIPTSSEHKEEAWLLCKYLGGKNKDGSWELPKRWALDVGLLPSYAELWDDPEVLEAFSSWANVTALKEQSLKTVYMSNINPVRDKAYYPLWCEMFNTEVQQAVLGYQTIRQALDNVWTKTQEFEAEL